MAAAWKIRRAVAWIGFLVVLLGASGGAQGRVVCFGFDGHVALEADVGDGSCGAPAPLRAPAVSGAGSEGGAAGWHSTHCGPCTDFALSFREAARIVPRELIAGGAPALLPGDPTSTVRSPVEPGAVPAGEGARRPPDPTLPSLRTTHLLI